ncbi:MAG TPA: RNA-binding protein [Gammaproteobacteria bacterium]|nr:RNA-binding protein [Gammaproteobacteria bacterium]
MNVVIGNLPDDAKEEEIREILAEHGVPVTGIRLTNEGDATRQTAVVSLDTDHAGAEALAGMLHNRFWRGHRLRAQAMMMFTGEDKPGSD